MKTYGYNTKVRFGENPGTLYRIATGAVNYKADTHDVSDTGTPAGGPNQDEPRRERGPGLGEAEVRMTAFSDPDNHIHVAPYNLRAGRRVPLILVFVNGEDQEPDRLENVLIDTLDKDPIGDPNQPNRVIFHGFCAEFTEADMI